MLFCSTFAKRTKILESKKLKYCFMRYRVGASKVERQMTRYTPPRTLQTTATQTKIYRGNLAAAMPANAAPEPPK
jgi:hypothetical protein